MSSYTANFLNQYTQRTVPGYAGVHGSATNNATVTVNGNAAWRLGNYFYGKFRCLSSKLLAGMDRRNAV